MSYRPPKRAAGQGSTRVQRLFQILTILYEQAYQNDGRQSRVDGLTYEWLTTGQIAREMKLTTSPHLRGLLDELLGQGCIYCQAIDWRPNMQAYVWRIHESALRKEQWRNAWEAWLSPSEALS